jgi:hypothetical protein
MIIEAASKADILPERQSFRTQGVSSKGELKLGIHF